MNDYAQRMSANNDGMDPDLVSRKFDSIEKLKELIYSIEPIIETARRIPDESAAVDGKITINWYQFSTISPVWNRIVKAYDEVTAVLDKGERG